MYIPYAPSDTGNSIGSALYLNYNILGKSRKKINNSPFVGIKFNKDSILKSVQKRKINFNIVKNYHKFIAEECLNNKVIGFFNEKLEFGDRALGCRSILGNPINKNIKNLINNSIKYRETYRPFAPSITEENLKSFLKAMAANKIIIWREFSK